MRTTLHPVKTNVRCYCCGMLPLLMIDVDRREPEKVSYVVACWRPDGPECHGSTEEEAVMLWNARIPLLRKEV